MKEVTVLCASGSLGLTPFHDESFAAGVARGPDAIVADAGSGDIGPFYLGSGAPYNPWEWEKHDLGLMLEAALKLGVPMIVGSCGGAGTNAAVDRYADILREVARERRLPRFKTAIIYAEVDLADCNSCCGEVDVFGAQQYAPLLDVEIPWNGD